MHGVNSIPELELMANSGIGLDYLKKTGIEKLWIGIEKFGIGIEISLKKLNPQINLAYLPR